MTDCENSLPVKYVATALIVVLASGFSLLAAESRPNVLFIAIDDLRPALRCYGDPVALTPHIDRLAERGMRFSRAYCQQAVCSPSRLSLMTGRRPDTIRVWDLQAHFRDTLPEVITLPQHFKSHGYDTRSIGKLYHSDGRPAKDPLSWSHPPQLDIERGPNTRYATAENRAGQGLKRASVESIDVPDDTYIDGLVCEAALTTLTELHAAGKPFFLGVGFRKPHLPFTAPKKYWDLYERDAIPPPETTTHPSGAPELAVRSWRELEGYSDVPSDGSLSADQVQELRHGYYACVSYIDALTGRLLERLDELDLTDKTIVCLWGDHGFHLGEQGLWTKGNNFELSTRIPLILAFPGQPERGAATEALVELVDVYPTLAALAGLPAPGGVEGTNLRPLLENPHRPWKKAAFSQYPRAREGHRHRGAGEIMGRTIRTERYRYVEWRDNETQQLLARELYDHRTDPGEMTNLAHAAGGNRLLQRLQQQLQAGWSSALPTP